MKLHAIFAEFADVGAVTEAARRVREAGYRDFDVHTPFPVHGLDRAMGVRPTRLPWLVLGAGLAGGSLAMLFMGWTSTVDYPFRVSGKPLFSLPAFVPVAFEVTILFAAFATFLGMLALNGLPALFQPLLGSSRFRRATADRFALAISARDPLFHPERTRVFLATLGALAVEECPEPDEPASLPGLVRTAGLVLSAAALIPPLYVANARLTTSETPRLHVVGDMDAQPKRKPQTVSPIFFDGRASRPDPAGTVARGELRADRRLHEGRDDDGSYANAFPVPVDERLARRGKARYEIFCATCHGLAGDGDGLVARRAQERKEASFVPPTAVHAPQVQAQPPGQLFETVTKGVRTMPGYGHLIPPEDRWAIVLYLRALGRSRAASMSDVPVEMREGLK